MKFPVDEFSKSVFLFSIRISSRVGHYQTYVPSITHLLKNDNKLTKQELDEITTLYILHLIHFNNNNLLAIKIFFQYIPLNEKIRNIMQIWRNEDYFKWFNLYNNEHDSSRKRIMKFGEKKMISHAIKCIQKSYNQLPKTYLNKIFYNKELKEFCDWNLNDSTILIKRK